MRYLHVSGTVKRYPEVLLDKMDTGLKYPSAHYLEKLSLYAADTVEVKSATGMCNYKVNRHELPVVVERVADYFKIYFSKIPSLSTFTTEAKSIDASTEFYARVSATSKNVHINIRMKKWSVVAVIFWLVLGVSIGFLSGKLSICIFIAIVFLAATAFLLHGRQRLKSMVVHFMNEL